MTLNQNVKLKNGAEEHGAVVIALQMSLRNLMKKTNDPDGLKYFLSLYELKEKCLDPNYRIFSPIQANILKELELIEENEQVHTSVRNVVLSSLEFDKENFEIILNSPIAPQETPKEQEEVAMEVDENDENVNMEIDEIFTAGQVENLADEL